jgi:glycosyl transferase family 25
MLENFGIEGIYIVHAKKGYEKHEQRINNLFNQLGLKYEFVTDGDPSQFSSDLLNKYFSPDIRNIFTDGSISCTLNHFYCYERVVKNQNKFALIFENDPFFLGNFLQKIEKVAAEANNLEKGFLISLENTTLKFPSFWKAKKNKYLYEANFSRCAGAYMIDLKCAELMLQSLKTDKCERIIDWWQNGLIDNKVIKVYWAHPPLVEQGSHNGLLNAGISAKKKGLIRRFRWNAQKIYKMYIMRLFKYN